VHLGLLREGQDLEGEPGALRAALRELGDPLDLADLEAALERLGARACLRNRPERCPLAEACPARAAQPPPAD
jgi:adenine-specific DNA glycosylase